MKRIIIPHGEIKKIANAMGVVPKTIREALTYKSKTKLSKKIRHTALTHFNGAEINF